MKISGFIFIFFILTVSSLFAQSKHKKNYYKFVLADSSQIVGRIVLENEKIIQIKSIDEAEFRLNRTNVVKQIPVKVDLANLKKNGILHKLGAVEQNDSSLIYRVELTGGSVLIGHIIKEDSTSLTINMLSKTKVTINKELIENKSLVSGKISEGEYWIDDPNKTRLYFAPTGKGLKNGEGYFSVSELFFPMLALGVGDFLTIAGGISIFPGGSDQIIYFSPKLTPYQDDKFAVSVGDFLVKSTDGDTGLNILYTVSTFSTATFSFTAGLGMDTGEKEAVLMLGGEVRASKYAKFITENWFFNDEGMNFLSFGVRFFGENLAADFAFVLPWDEGPDNGLLPWVSFAYNF
jgi:hypothetical protein